MTSIEFPSRARRLVSALLVCGLALPAAAAPAAPPIPVQAHRVVHTYPHDPAAFTQGLLYQDGFLYESTGLYGRSSVRRVRLDTGTVLQHADLPAEVFGEGMTAWGDRLIVLTWQSQSGFVLDRRSFSVLRRFAYAGEGWGLTHNGRELIMSDGSADLRFLDPQTLRELRRLRVTANGQPVNQLNELEWVDGQVLANIWQTDRIARIDPATGRVLAWIDLAGLLSPADRAAHDPDVLNGIAYDAANRRLFVTGKRWPKLFEIRLVTPSAAAR